MSRFSKYFLTAVAAVLLVGAGFSAQLAQSPRFLGLMDIYAIDSDAAEVIRFDPSLNGGTIQLEGPTKDAFETRLNASDVTADVDINFPLNNAVDGAVMVSSLTTNSAQAANSVWAESNSLNGEGATANAFEWSISPTDPTADVAVTIPDAPAVTIGEFTVAGCTGPLATGSVDQLIFIATRAYTILDIDYVHQVAESAGTVTVIPERRQGTEAAAAGDDLITGSFDGTATADTIQNGTLSATTTLAIGDRIGLDFTDDVPGELLNVCVSVRLMPN